MSDSRQQAFDEGEANGARREAGRIAYKLTELLQAGGDVHNAITALINELDAVATDATTSTDATSGQDFGDLVADAYEARREGFAS